MRGLRMPLGRTDLVLVIWFTTMSVYRVIGPAIAGPVDFGWDAVVYTRAARALLDGGNPWLAGIPNATFAAPPPSLIPFLPFAYLPEPVVQATWVGLGIVAAIYVIRRLRLAWWWLLFPPLLLSMAAGSSALPLVALLVRGGIYGDAAGAVGRIYSAVPLALLGRWRALLVAGLTIVATAPFLAWDRYLRDLPVITARLAEQSGGGNSATAIPILIPVALLGLFLLGRRKAAWLAVPALWPNAQEYYAVIALPVAAEVPLATMAMATPLVPGIIAVGLFLQGAWDRLRGRAPGAGTAAGSTSVPGAGTVAGSTSATIAARGPS
jgi:hypothetical protein